MNARRTGQASAVKRRRARPAAGTTDWSRLRSLRDAEIAGGIAADPDARPTDAAFWRAARLRMPEPKESITIRLDADLLRWFRRRKGYQTRMNAVLRAYMEAKKHGGM